MREEIEAGRSENIKSVHLMQISSILYLCLLTCIFLTLRLGLAPIT